MEAMVLGEMRKLFNPEFINRIDEIIVFDALTEEQLADIAKIMIQRLNASLVEREIHISVTEDVCSWLVRTTCQDRSFGARPLRRAIQRHIEDALSEALITGRFQEGGQIEVFLEDDALAFRSAMEASPTNSG